MKTHLHAARRGANILILEVTTSATESGRQIVCGWAFRMLVSFAVYHAVW
ncbi:MAG: hypothetical protein ACRD3V_04630 [Vicinamibacteria bacterium]